jgi:membrane-associated phospholipid phosphatase
VEWEYPRIADDSRRRVILGSTMKNSHCNRLILALILGLLGVCQAVYAAYATYFPGDVQVVQWLQSFHSPAFTTLMIGVSQAFTSWRGDLLAAACILFIWWRLGLLEAIILTAAVLISPLAEVSKILVNRPRPIGMLVHILLPASGLSFPSGHSFFAAMLLGTLGYFTLIFVRRPLKYYLAGALVFLILLVGFSRVYLGAHWGSDVVGAYFFAGFFLLLLSVIYEELKGYLGRRRGNQVDVSPESINEH